MCKLLLGILLSLTSQLHADGKFDEVFSAGQFIKLPGLSNLNISKGGTFSLGKFVIRNNDKPNDTHEYPISIRLKAEKSEVPKSIPLDSNFSIQLLDNGETDFKIDREIDAAGNKILDPELGIEKVKSVKVNLHFKVRDSTGQLNQLSFQTEDITELYMTALKKAVKSIGPGKIAESLAKRALEKLLEKNLFFDDVKNAIVLAHPGVELSPLSQQPIADKTTHAPGAATGLIKKK